MQFRVLPAGQRIPREAGSIAFLVIDHWDDWFKYNTLYSLILVDDQGNRHDIGGVKIGQFKMKDGQRRPEIPQDFEQLDEQFFSLGQDDSYYENLNLLGQQIANDVLVALRDIAANRALFDRALLEDVTGVSLLRSVSPATVRGQFRRLAGGGARLSKYAFEYQLPPASKNAAEVSLGFEVVPDSEPPSNIHVLIGRNGVGKTTLLYRMTRALADERARPAEVGSFHSGEAEGEFANLVSVSFSAFDSFEPLSNPQNRATGLRYTYVGLKRIRTTADKKPLPPKSPSRLAREFSDSVRICLQGARLNRWRRALATLEADPLFKDAGITQLAGAPNELSKSAADVFSELSSGHKIVLLTITRLVETVEEKTLVLLDEPEAHLHPPLLSAFVRALSDLLIDRNGVAIIATHSPVVLQEVPRSCVWKIRRNGRRIDVERPEIETFGENVGVLTREAFGFEVTQSGFHQLLRQSVSEDVNFDEVLRQFDGELGGEAKAIVRALIITRNRARD